jgi:acetyl esterase/lipase
MAIFAGNAQTGVVGSALAIAPAVKLLDAGGNPVAGVAVTFTAGGGGSVAGANAVTASDGVARAGSWTLGTTAGAQNLTASATGGGFAGNPLTFNATAIPGPPSLNRSSLQALKSSVTAAEPAGIRVTVRDAYGNAVSGVTVTLSASGSDNQIQQPPATSNGTADGALSSTRAEQKTVTAAIAGMPISGSVSVTVNPGPVASITMSPSGITGIAAGATLTVSAAAADQYGNAISNPGFVWSSSRTSVATVNSSGVVTGVAPVSAMIRATVGTLSASTEVAVYGAMTLDSLPYCTPNGKTLTLDMFAPPASHVRPAPIAIYIHGGGWVDGDSKGGWQFDSFKSLLLSRGYIVASLDYRLAPGTNGSAMWRAQGQDVACAIRFLRASAVRYGVDPDGIALWGRSAGGHLAALLGLTNDNFGYATEYAAYSSQVQAVAGLAGVYDLTRPSQVPALIAQHETPDSVFRGWPEDSTSAYILGASPTRRVSSGGAAFLIIVPEFDTDVLPIQSVTLHNTLLGHSLSSQLLTLQHADHSLEPVTGFSETEPSRAEVVSIIANFFDGALGRGGAASPLASSRTVRTENSTNVAPHPVQSGAREGSFRVAY